MKMNRPRFAAYFQDRLYFLLELLQSSPGMRNPLSATINSATSSLKVALQATTSTSI